MEIIGIESVDLSEIIVNLRTCWIDASAQGVHVEVVGARESDAKLGVSQGAVVAPLFGADKAHIGNRKAETVGVLGRAVIVGGMEVVHQVERGSKLIAAVNAQASRIDADGGHVATHCTEGDAHAQSLGSALVIGL